MKTYELHVKLLLLHLFKLPHGCFFFSTEIVVRVDMAESWIWKPDLKSQTYWSILYTDAT